MMVMEQGQAMGRVRHPVQAPFRARRCSASTRSTAPFWPARNCAAASMQFAATVGAGCVRGIHEGETRPGFL